MSKTIFVGIMIAIYIYGSLGVIISLFLKEPDIPNMIFYGWLSLMVQTSLFEILKEWKNEEKF